ncbi:response regulator [Parasedimentitalea maritima]|uniref:histidine kinase n=1 Tax=Parasedimentitalea maritima TaxID=2578117 RepID=A0ABY2V305_9RHOB|nr:response regulator [Zongyanglinia marina]
MGAIIQLSSHDDLSQFAQLATPLWVFDVDRHKIWWANPAGIDFWEAHNLLDLLDRDFSTDSDTVRTRLQQIVNSSSGSERIQDTWTLYPNGDPKTVSLSFLPIHIEGNVNAVLIEVKQYFDNNTDQESLRILEAARASALMVSTFSADGRLLAQNPAALNCYGTATSGLLGNDMVGRLKDPDVANQLLSTATGGKSFDTEQEMRTQNGFRVHRILARRGRDPVTGAFVAVLSEEDITKQAIIQRQMQELNEMLEAEVIERTRKLAESEERYALATQNAAIWDWDIEQDHLFVSPSFIEALKYDPSDFRAALASSGIAELVHPDDVGSYRAELDRHLNEPDVPFQHEHRFLMGTGEFRWFHALGKCVVDHAGVPKRSVGLLTDISDRKRLEASLFSAQRLEAIGQLTGGIAHDFNNLLTVVQGNAELLEIVDDPDHELAGQIIKAAQRGAELTRHLLAFSRKQTLLPRSVDLSDLVSTISKTLLRVLGEEVSVTAQLEDDLWAIHADPTQVESAILNVALNARDAMPQGGKLVIECKNREIPGGVGRSNIEFSLQPGQYVEITIRDTGLGMSENTLARAFEPFFTTKEVGQGSGLGLSMVFGFSRQSGGDATIQTTPGKGTTISITLPRSDRALETKAVTRPSDVIQGNGEHIHVLEDNPDVQKVIFETLETMDYRVSLSSNAEAAMQAVTQKPHPDLILADVILPGGQSGLDFARQISILHPGIKIVLMSGYPEGPLTEIALVKEGYAFLQKPMERVLLSQTIHSVLNG